MNNPHIMTTQRPSEHCPDGFAFGLWCQACGETRGVFVPCSVDDFVLQGEAFAKTHEGCITRPACDPPAMVTEDMHVTGDGFFFGVGGEFAAEFAILCIAAFREVAGAVNYVEWTVTSVAEEDYGQEYTVLIQRKDGATPAEMKIKACDALRGILDAIARLGLEDQFKGERRTAEAFAAAEPDLFSETRESPV